MQGSACGLTVYEVTVSCSMPGLERGGAALQNVISMGKLATLKPKVIRHRLNMSNPEVAVATVGPVGENPAQIMCTKCHRTVVSEVKYSSGLLTYLFCGGLFLCGFVFGCCLIPFCVDRLKDAKHTCPICKTVLGVYRRL